MTTKEISKRKLGETEEEFKKYFQLPQTNSSKCWPSVLSDHIKHNILHYIINSMMYAFVLLFSIPTCPFYNK